MYVAATSDLLLPLTFPVCQQCTSAMYREFKYLLQLFDNDFVAICMSPCIYTYCMLYIKTKEESAFVSSLK